MAAQSKKCQGQRGWGITSHSRLEEWGDWGYPPHKPLPARGHDSPQPQILPPLSSKPNGEWPHRQHMAPPASVMVVPTTMATALSGSQPQPPQGAAEVSPPWSSVMLLTALPHCRRGKPEAAVAAQEQALRLVSCHWAQGSPEVRELSVRAALEPAIKWVWSAVIQVLGHLSVPMLADTCLWLLPVPWHRNTRQ